MAHRLKSMVRKTVSVLGLATLVTGAALVGHRRAQFRADLDATAALVAPGPGANASPGEAPAPDSGWDIPNLDHARVDYWIGRFQTDKRADFETYLKRMGRYASLIS